MKSVLYMLFGHYGKQSTNTNKIALSKITLYNNCLVICLLNYIETWDRQTNGRTHRQSALLLEKGLYCV